MKKIQNLKLAGQKLRYQKRPDSVEMSEAVGDAEGTFELPDDVADKLLGTPGWSAPTKRAPRKAKTRPQTPPKPETPQDPEEGSEEGEEGGEGEEEGEDVPPYSEWDYQDLKAEAKKRMDDPKFQPPDSAKAADIIKALEADDAREGA